MWLSERTAGHVETGGETAAGAMVGTVTIGGEGPAVLLDGEYRALGIAGPPGLSWRPGIGTQVLVIETGDGERFIAGAVDGKENAAPEPGELRLGNDGTWLKIGGGIESMGTVRHSGDVYITGRLFLNGKEITVKEETS